MGTLGSSNVYSFTKQTKVAPASVTSPLAEATDLSASYTQILTGNADATSTNKGIAAFITDQDIVWSVLDVLPQFSGVLARTVMEQYETDLATAGSTFTNISGSSTATTNMNLFLVARGALSGRDVAGNAVAVLHTKQAQDLQTDIATSGATFLAGAEAGQVGGVLSAGLSGFVGSLFGVSTYQTTVVPTADAGASRAGYMFVAGEALGLYETWGIRTELQRRASKVGTDIVVTANYGTVVIDQNRGQLLKGTS